MSDTVIAGRYRLDNLLGRGGMSEVWRAEDLELGRHVAIKLLAPDAGTARFQREARAVASLAHPNITQLYDYGHEAGRPYMVLEYVPGGTLETRLREGKPLPDDETQAIAVGIAAGLAHAHARGVVHRDLKPANVLFDADGRPKIADFGIARMAVGDGTLTEAGTVLGTAAYISPEQATGDAASAASDVYSWGVILYRMLTGRLPFESDDPLELVALHRDAAPPPIARFRQGAPAQLEAAATAALTKAPRDRPRDGAALLAELGASAGAGADAGDTSAATLVLPADATRVLPRAEGEPEARPPSRRPRPALLVGVVVLLLALGGGALAYALTSSSSSPQTDTTVAPSTLDTTRRATTAEATAEQTTQPTTHEASTQQTTTQATTAPTTTPATTTPATTTATLPATTATLATTAPTVTEPLGTTTTPLP